MTCSVNLKSIIQAKEFFTEAEFQTYTDYHKISLKPSELLDLEILANVLIKADCKVSDLDNFFVGFSIAQIGKEFDLLRFNENQIVNIEIKSKSTEEKIKLQLQKNKYYLNFLGKKIHPFTFISSTQNIFYLGDDDILYTATPNQLLETLRNQQLCRTSDPAELFDPSDYLVSPFNSTDKFLSKSYFLTLQQEKVKATIFDTIGKTKASKFYSISGSAGTGKTLLTYDLIRDFNAEGNKTLIIHCGSLNEGHEILRSQGWTIVAIKDYANRNFSDFSLVVIDESQRIKTHQFKDIVEKISNEKIACIFSHDQVQTLNHSEAANKITQKIRDIPNIEIHELSEKIRTNKEVSDFIKRLFNNKKNYLSPNYKNIYLSFFNNIEDAKQYLSKLSKENWEVLRFTPSQYDQEHHQKYFQMDSKSSHKVIGQEYERVAVAIDQFFSYDQAGDLTYTNSAYYSPVKMLFQNITRARKQIHVVIIANREIYRRCLQITS